MGLGIGWLQLKPEAAVSSHMGHPGFQLLTFSFRRYHSFLVEIGAGNPGPPTLDTWIPPL